MKNTKEWKNVELNKTDAEIFRKYLKENDFHCYPSECFNLTHFDIYVDDAETEAIKSFLRTM